MKWCSAVVVAVGVVLSTGLVAGPASAASPASSSLVRFVLKPTWLPSGFSASGGGWVTPPGGLDVYPQTGRAGIVSVGSYKGPHSTPVLFTLTYYGFHNPESKSIHLFATKAISPPTNGNNQGTLRLNGRRVMMTSHTEGVFHNIVTTASWHERGDVVTVSTEGLTTAQTSRFIEGLSVQNPPSR